MLTAEKSPPFVNENREEYFVRVKTMRARQDEKIRKLEARVNELGKSCPAEVRQALVDVLELKIKATGAMNDLQLTSETGWSNAVIAAEGVWRLVDKAIRRFEIRLTALEEKHAECSEGPL